MTVTSKMKTLADTGCEMRLASFERRRTGRTYGLMDGRTDGRTYGPTDGRNDGRICGRTYGQTYGRTDGRSFFLGEFEYGWTAERRCKWGRRG